MSKTLYRIQVTPNHRFDELSVATKKGKVWVGKDTATIVGSDDLLPGEEFKLARYREEGRMFVDEVDAGAPAPVSKPESTPPPSFDEPDIAATDSAWLLAQEHDIDLAEVEGTGKDGRVIRSDVESLIAE